MGGTDAPFQALRQKLAAASSTAERNICSQGSDERSAWSNAGATRRVVMGSPESTDTADNVRLHVPVWPGTHRDILCVISRQCRCSAIAESGLERTSSAHHAGCTCSLGDAQLPRSPSPHPRPNENLVAFANCGRPIAGATPLAKRIGYDRETRSARLSGVKRGCARKVGCELEHECRAYPYHPLARSRRPPRSFSRAARDVPLRLANPSPAPSISGRRVGSSRDEMPSFPRNIGTVVRASMRT